MIFVPQNIKHFLWKHLGGRAKKLEAEESQNQRRHTTQLQFKMRNPFCLSDGLTYIKDITIQYCLQEMMHKYYYIENNTRR